MVGSYQHDTLTSTHITLSGFDGGEANTVHD